MGRRWLYPEPLPESAIEALQAYSRIEQFLFYGRGLQDSSLVRAFLTNDAPENTDPFLLPDMQTAVARIREAIADQTPMVIYGDYDVDGITSVVLLTEVLERLGARVSHFIPDRVTHGYGLSKESLRDLAAGGARLVVTVDCGTRAIDPIEDARQNGLEVIVTDHHQPGNELPAAIAVINPQRKESTYPFRHLAGVGVAYKLSQALTQSFGSEAPDDLLDLVALGTVADLAPMIGENRFLVQRGLEAINRSPRMGVQALIQEIRARQGFINTGTIGFQLGPRLNAAGRIANAEPAVQLLRTRDPLRATDLAFQLSSINNQRRQLTQSTAKRALEIVGEGRLDEAIIIAEDPDFKEGVVGLAASRIAELYQRPTLVGVRRADTTRYSARSVEGVSIINLLDQCAEWMVRYGGHDGAAGLTIENHRLEEFKRRLLQVGASQIKSEDLEPMLMIDAEVYVDEINEQLLELQTALEPTGKENPLPLYALREVRLLQSYGVGSQKEHLKMAVGEFGRPLEAIAFRMGHLLPMLPERIELAFQLERSSYSGGLQLIVRDIRWPGMD